MHHDGSYRWIDLTITNLVDNPAVDGLVVNGRDVSDSREPAGRDSPSRRPTTA